VLFWQLNEPWPTVCWSVIDYYGRPKLAYETVKEIYNPLLGMLDWRLKSGQFSADVIVANDFPTPRENLTIQVNSHEAGHSQEIFSAPVSVAAESVTGAGNFAFEIPAEWSLKEKFNWKMHVLLLDQGEEVLSTNSYRPFLYRERSRKPLWVWHLVDQGREFSWGKIPQIWNITKTDRIDE
jgi:hypothetical protein